MRRRETQIKQSPGESVNEAGGGGRENNKNESKSEDLKKKSRKAVM